LETAFTTLQRTGAMMLDRAGVVSPNCRRFERSIDARYPRQSFELVLPVSGDPVDPQTLQEIAEKAYPVDSGASICCMRRERQSACSAGFGDDGARAHAR